MRWQRSTKITRAMKYDDAALASLLERVSFFAPESAVNPVIRGWQADGNPDADDHFDLHVWGEDDTPDMATSLAKAPRRG